MGAPMQCTDHERRTRRDVARMRVRHRHAIAVDVSVSGHPPGHAGRQWSQDRLQQCDEREQREYDSKRCEWRWECWLHSRASVARRTRRRNHRSGAAQRRALPPAYLLGTPARSARYSQPASLSAWYAA